MRSPSHRTSAVGAPSRANGASGPVPVRPVDRGIVREPGRCFPGVRSASVRRCLAHGLLTWPYKACRRVSLHPEHGMFSVALIESAISPLSLRTCLVQVLAEWPSISATRVNRRKLPNEEQQARNHCQGCEAGSCEFDRCRRKRRTRRRAATAERSRPEGERRGRERFHRSKALIAKHHQGWQTWPLLLQGPFSWPAVLLPARGMRLPTDGASLFAGRLARRHQPVPPARQPSRAVAVEQAQRCARRDRREAAGIELEHYVRAFPDGQAERGKSAYVGQASVTQSGFHARVLARRDQHPGFAGSRVDMQHCGHRLHASGRTAFQGPASVLRLRRSGLVESGAQPTRCGGAGGATGGEIGGTLGPACGAKGPARSNCQARRTRMRSDRWRFIGRGLATRHPLERAGGCRHADFTTRVESVAGNRQCFAGGSALCAFVRRRAGRDGRRFPGVQVRQ